MMQMYPPDFIRDHIEIEHPIHGAIPFMLKDYQEEIINDINLNSGVLIHHARQMGITTTVLANILMHAMYRTGFTAVVLVPNSKSVKVVRDKLNFMYDRIHPSLKPACHIKRRDEIGFANSSYILVRTVSACAVRGIGFSMMYIMDGNYANQKDMEDLWLSVAPVIATGADIIFSDSHVMQNSVFRELWLQSEMGFNNYKRIEVPWHRK